MAVPRQRLPAPLTVILVVCLLGAGFFAVPWIGAHQVNATVTTYRGPDRQCEVAGIDPDSGGEVAGLVPCGGRREGDAITVRVFGWPRSGTIEDPVNSIGLALLIGGLGIFMFSVPLAIRFRIRRRFRELRPST